MITKATVIIKPENEKNESFIMQEIIKELNKKNIFCSKEDIQIQFEKKSIDARRSQVKLVMRYTVYIGEDPKTVKRTSIPVWKKAESGKSVIIVGAGPAGLFGALKLLEYGIKPVIIDRGSDTSKRKRDIAAISTKGIVDEDSNYCFGEGGAGTFSDGKLYTRSNKRGNINSILEIFAHFGADKNILTDAHPHIGTDRLPQIINAMREKIISLGGEFYFDTKCIWISSPEATSVKTVNTVTGEENTFTGDAVLLATGHSAKDIYTLLAKTAPLSLEAKTFAVGVRCEHPRDVIDRIQYHGKDTEKLGAAEYRFTSQQKERGVYSFCMCPGGFVVPSATGPDEIVVNGMSAKGRNSRWSNAAIVVETRPEDIPEEFEKLAEQEGSSQLKGLLWRSWLEAETFRHGEGQKAPSQRLTDFLSKKDTVSFPDTSYTPGITASRLDQWLPPFISERLAMGFKTFDRDRHGFICEDAILIASETRTSTPVRILRDKNTYECTALKKLFPCGEGSGYSGGIVSSAMDGENACKAIADILLK